MPVKMPGGKEYQTVAERLIKLREKWPHAIIETKPIITNHGLIMETKITVDTHTATGHAYCDPRSDHKVMEKTESVSCGRAMAFLDVDLMGSEIASADEISEWNYGNAKKEIETRYRNYGFALQRNLPFLAAIQQQLNDGELAAAWESWNEIPEDDRRALRVASTKGGWLSVEEAKRLGEASNQDFDPERGVYRSIAGDTDE